jgi:phosphoribosylglycinamide formyltransferase-1
VIGVLVSGNGTNLQALLDAGLPVSAVAANRKDAYALVRARQAGVTTATFSLDCHADRRERDLVMATWLEEHGVELVETTGVSVHYVDEGLDTGRLIVQEDVPVEPRDTLVERIHAVEHRLLPEVVRDLCLAAH